MYIEAFDKKIGFIIVNQNQFALGIINVYPISFLPAYKFRKHIGHIAQQRYEQKTLYYLYVLPSCNKCYVDFMQLPASAHEQSAQC